MRHIKHMTLTTIPAYNICAVIFGVMGLKFDASSYDPAIVNNTITSLSGIFNFSFIELLPIVVVITLLVKKTPPIIALLSGTFAGILVAIFRQGESVQALLGFLYNGYSVDSGLIYIDK